MPVFSSCYGKNQVSKTGGWPLELLLIRRTLKTTDSDAY